MFKNRIFLVFVLLGIFISVPNFINSTFVTLYIRDLGGNEVWIGWSTGGWMYQSLGAVAMYQINAVIALFGMWCYTSRKEVNKTLQNAEKTLCTKGFSRL